MNDELYNMIFKRKSFHLFRNIGDKHITDEEIKDIENKFNTFIPLVEDIKVKIKIVKDSTTCKRGQEYCILLYSEKKDNYLQNIGYIGEQLDLYLVSKNIGTLWFGIGKVEQTQLDGLNFVIMIAIAKVDLETKFRKQPWIVDSSQNELKVYRYRKPGKRGIMPIDMVKYYNQIDIGIFLCFLELCLNKNNIQFERNLYVEKNVDNEKNLTATYRMK